MEQSKKLAMNPYLPLNVCIADGEPHVFGNRVYVFGSHDCPGGDAMDKYNMNFYLAIDIGASSGRHIVGWREDGEIKTKEVYRFPNGVQERNGIWSGMLTTCLPMYRRALRRQKPSFPAS